MRQLADSHQYIYTPKATLSCRARIISGVFFVVVVAVVVVAVVVVVVIVGVVVVVVVL